MVALRDSDGLVDDLLVVASTLDSLDLRAARHTRSGADVERDRLVGVLRSYLTPRLDDPGTPLTVVFAGPTGAGKSTLINTISGLEVSLAGPLRPTTKTPVVLAAAKHESLFEAVGGVQCLVATGKAPILDSMALIDTPDIDSTSLDHRVIAESMIDNADVVVFVSSALRYADLVPWQVLRRAQSRGATVIHVLNRVSSDTGGAIVDYQRLLQQSGFGQDLIRVPEHHAVSSAQSVPPIASLELKRRLLSIAMDRETYRHDVVRRVLAATLSQIADLYLVVEADAVWIEGHIEEEVARLKRPTIAELSSFGHLVSVADPPHGTGKRRIRRWWRLNRLTDVGLASFRSSLVAGLAGTVESDLLSKTEQSRLAPHLREAIRSEFTGWLEEFEASVAVLRKKRRNLAFVLLVVSVLGQSHDVVLSSVFGGDTDRILADLTNKLDQHLARIYGEVSAWLARSVRSRIGTPDPGNLLGETTRIVARSHFADA